METIRISFPIKTNGSYDETKAVSYMMAGLKKLVEFGAIKGDIDTILQSYEIATPGGYAVAILDKQCLVDGSKLNSTGSRLSFPMDIIPETLELKDKGFSVATIQERLRIQGLDPKMKFRYTINDYKKYYKANQNKLKSEPNRMKILKNMFITDMMGIFNDILPYIQEGKQLATLTGLTTITDGMNSISKDLSLAYRRALQQAKKGQISPSAFKTLQAKYSQFMNILITQIFPGIEDILTEETRTHSSRVTGTITIQCTNPEQLYDIISYLNEVTSSGHDTTIVIGRGTDKEKEFVWDGDGNDKIKSINMSKVQVDNKSYSLTSEGRLKLF